MWELPKHEASHGKTRRPVFDHEGDIMKLERRITTEDSSGVARMKVIAYFEKLGYQTSQSGMVLTFQRGSRVGSMFSSAPQKWQTQATAQLQQSVSQASEVLIQIDAKPIGHMVTPNEKNLLERELDGLVKILNVVEYESKLPSIVETDVRERLKAENRLKSGANSFFLIAGFSLVNTVLFFLGGRLNFLIGLGITQLIDGIASGVAAGYSADVGLVAKLVALLIDIMIAGVFVLFGVFARKRAKWSFFVGATLYSLDALIFLLVKDVLSIGFHILMLFWLFSGMMAIDRLKQLTQTRAQI